MTGPRRCLLHLHSWRIQHDDEGQRFQTCDRCGARRDTTTLTDTAGMS
jgi:hypothetical protein